MEVLGSLYNVIKMIESFGEPVECDRNYWKFWTDCRMWSEWTKVLDSL